jgi:hypothetical protein
MIRLDADKRATREALRREIRLSGEAREGR